MIPFWKKTGKHNKPQSAQKRRQNAKPAVPRTAQQSIPMQRMFEDGTCRVKPNYYTRTIQYQDINYQLAQQEDKTAIFEEWCSFLNFFDSSIKFELSFVNMATDSTEFEKSIRIPFQKDGFDDVRAEYSQMLRQQLAKGNNGLTKTKFITFGVKGESMAQVKPRLDHIQNDLLNNFHRLGVQAKPLNGVQRLRLMHDMQDVNHQLFTESVLDEILLSMRTENKQRAREILKEMDLLSFEDSHPMGLSGGQKQRVAVASAIASERPLILFDEPTSGLDLFHMRQVANVVNQVANAGRTALVVTHDPEFILRCCNYVLHLENGQIQESYSIEDSNGRKRLLKFFLSDMKKEVSTE